MGHGRRPYVRYIQLRRRSPRRRGELSRVRAEHGRRLRTPTSVSEDLEQKADEVEEWADQIEEASDEVETIAAELDDLDEEDDDYNDQRESIKERVDDRVQDVLGEQAV